MRNLIYILALSIILVSCNAIERPKKPANLISKDKMEAILYDLYVINAAKGVNRTLLEDKGIVPESYVLNKHQIDSAQFANSNAYYAFDPEVYKGIVEKVKARLETNKETLEAIEKKEKEAAKQKRDSISKIKIQVKDSIKEALKKKVSR